MRNHPQRGGFPFESREARSKIVLVARGVLQPKPTACVGCSTQQAASKYRNRGPLLLQQDPVYALH